MGRFRICCIALVAALALSACGGDDAADGDGSPLDDSRTIEQKTADFDLADAALLVLSDLPAGWTVDVPEEDPAADDALFACVQPEHEDVIRNEESDADRTFGDGADSRIVSIVGLYPNPEFADVVFEFGRHPKYDDCFRQTIAETLGAGLPPDVTVTARAEAQPAPSLGDEALALRYVVDVAGPGGQRSLVVDVVIVREGRTVSGLQAVGVGGPIDPALVARLAALTAERAAAAPS